MQDTISFHPLGMEPLYLLVCKTLEFMRNTLLAHFWEMLWPLCLHVGPSVNTKIPSKTFNKGMKKGKYLENYYHAYRDSATNCLRHYNRKIYAIIQKTSFSRHYYDKKGAKTEFLQEAHIQFIFTCRKCICWP